MRARIARLWLALCATLLVMVAAPVVARAAPQASVPAAAAGADAPSPGAQEMRRHVHRAAWRRHHHRHHHHRLRAHHLRPHEPETSLSAARGALATAARARPAGLCYSPGDPVWCGDLAAAEVGLATAINHALAAGVPVGALAEGAPAWQAERLQAAARSHAALIDAYMRRTSFVEDAAAAAERRSGRKAS